MIAALQDIRNAYDARDRDALEQALAKIEQAMRYTGPIPNRRDDRCTGCDGQGRCAGKDRCDL